ncbi:MBL fold metallo-hydrolase [Pendulispora brunnea]|uniref:MBL fold metallo-hydrolase n=1 Tax=Pendulispora brunnea TaxID=2905690 RepID=A0ABZ2JYR1_9BACT
MPNELFYLRPNVVIEPLFARWYAWLQLISPMTAPLFLVHQHLKIMRSFVAQPELHVAAMQDPQLIGGPYINYGSGQVGAVQAQIDETTRSCATMIEFAAALKSLDRMLADHALGMSLEAIYPRVPDILRGFVELGYDLENHLSVRLLEGLLYRSSHYHEAAQSLLLWRIDRDERPFIFSTPRLGGPGELPLERPFRDTALDEICDLRRRPAPIGRILELLDVAGAPEREELVRSFLTREPPVPAPRFEGDGLRVRYFGHACVLLESKGVSVLTDPALSYRYPTELPRFTFDDLPERIDYVLITHGHADHLMLETLLPLRSRIGTIVVPKSNGERQDPSLRLALRHLGFRNVVELDELEDIPFEGGSILGLPFLGEHGDLHIRSKLAYGVRLGGRCAVIAADSNVLEPELYRHVKEVLGPVDILFIGMESEGAPLSWIYGPLLFTPLARKMDQSRRLSGSNAKRAAALVDLLQPRHVRVYAMGQEPWLGHVMGLKYTDTSPQIVQSNELLAHCRASGIAAARPYCIEEMHLAP